MSYVHIWLFALVAGAFAPWCVQFFARAVERRVKRRTEALIARAIAAQEATLKGTEHRTTARDVERVEGVERGEG